MKFDRDAGIADYLYQTAEWDRIVVALTGEELNPRYYMNELKGVKN